MQSVVNPMYHIKKIPARAEGIFAKKRIPKLWNPFSERPIYFCAISYIAAAIIW